MSRQFERIAFAARRETPEIPASEDIVHVERHADRIGVAIEAAGRRRARNEQIRQILVHAVQNAVASVLRPRRDVAASQTNVPAFGAQIFDIAPVAGLIFACISRFSSAARTFVVVNALDGPSAAARSEIVEFEQIEKSLAGSVGAADDFGHGTASAVAAFIAQAALFSLVICARFVGILARSARAAAIKIGFRRRFASGRRVGVAIGITLFARIDPALSRNANRRLNMQKSGAIVIADARAVVHIGGGFAAVGRVAVAVFVAGGARAAIAPMQRRQIDARAVAQFFAFVAFGGVGRFFAFAAVGRVAVAVFVAGGARAAIAPMQRRQIDARAVAQFFAFVAFGGVGRFFAFAAVGRVAVAVFVAGGARAAIAPMQRRQIDARAVAQFFAFVAFGGVGRFFAFAAVGRVAVAVFVAGGARAAIAPMQRRQIGACIAAQRFVFIFARFCAVFSRFAAVGRVAVAVFVSGGAYAAIAPMQRRQIGACIAAHALRFPARRPFFHDAAFAARRHQKRDAQKCKSSVAIHFVLPDLRQKTPAKINRIIIHKLRLFGYSVRHFSGCLRPAAEIMRFDCQTSKRPAFSAEL